MCRVSEDVRTLSINSLHHDPDSRPAIMNQAATTDDKVLAKRRYPQMPGAE